MEGNAIQPVMPIGGYGDGLGYGGGSDIWLFASNGGLFGGNNAGNSNAIQADVNRGFDSQYRSKKYIIFNYCKSIA